MKPVRLLKVALEKVKKVVSVQIINTTGDRAAYCHLGGDTIQFAIQVQQYAIRFAISELL